MRWLPRRACVLASLLLGHGMLHAAAPADEEPPSSQENQDINLIPPAAQQQASPAESRPSVQSTAAQRMYLEDAFTESASRGGLLLPEPAPLPYDWQERLFLDLRRQWRPYDTLELNLGDRLNLRAENDISFPDHENLINDLREAYVVVEPADQTYLACGRINLKSGVALGFNPTDYFKTRAVVEPLTADPTVLREDRLGTLMIDAQRIWERGAVTAAFAPAIQRASPIYTNLDLPSFDPMLDRTNAQSRSLLKGTVNLGSNFSPELLLYRDGNRTQGGFNLAESLGPRLIGYLEWSGGRILSVIEAAYQFGRETGTLPANAPFVLPADSLPRFQQQLAIGGAYTSESRITVNVEYHLNQAGFTSADWRRWFAVGSGQSALSPIALELWLIRDYAFDQQEPIGRNSLFLRADWVDAIVPKLELTGIVDIDVRDGSELLQVGADYVISDRWTVGGLLLGYLGGRRSDFGSLPQWGSLLVKFARYF